MPSIKYLKSETAKLYKSATSNQVIIELLWGDRIELINANQSNGRNKVKVRGITGYVKHSDIGDEPLLELYFIDVGQGDGILIVTPDRKHILIDGGYKRSKQPHGKSAADFVDWKFKKDYGLDTITLDEMICSHCDADHYGGLWDLLSNEPEAKEELDTDHREVKHFYHAGVSWWKSNQNSRYLGREEDGYLHDLLTGKTSVKNGLKSTSPLRLQGEWADFLKCVIDHPNISIDRLAYNPDKPFKYLPGYDSSNQTSIKILGPIETIIDGKVKLKDHGSKSKNTNGNSVLLRLDYGRCRILLTGDLNKKSQQLILSAFIGSRQELAADVIKSCHHGSDDCSYEFLECVQASATVISSGDDETHAHPRPNIVAAHGLTGYKKINNDELITPLVYSTEISRSVKIGDPYKVVYQNYPVQDGTIPISLTDETKTKVSYKRTSSGALHPSDKTKSLSRLKIIDGIVYGLVNVRTDGNKILCATLNEGKFKWETQKFYSRF